MRHPPPAALLLAALTAPLPAQPIAGDWVEQADARIEQHRKKPLRVLVLDADGKPADGAVVKIEQERHAFEVGVIFAADQPPEVDEAAAVWRCVNAASVEPLSPVLAPATQPEASHFEREKVRADSVYAATSRGWRLVHGGLLSADPARNDPRVAELPPWKQVERAANHATASHHFSHVVAFDVYTDALTPDAAAALSTPQLRPLFQLVRARLPGAPLNVRMSDALGFNRVGRMVERVTELQRAFVPFNGLSIDQRLGGVVKPATVEGALESLAATKLPVVFGRLEPGGGSEKIAAINAEVFLRAAFAAPNVRGVYLPLDPDDPNATLWDDRGRPTDVGEVVDKLFRQIWWTDLEAVTDRLGNADVRVFAGRHKITASLTDGTSADTLVWVPTDAERETLIVLQPLSEPK